MRKPVDCFQINDLELYVQGRVDDELSDAIELHLEDCATCEDTVGDLGASDDTLIRTLRIKSAKGAQPSWIAGLAASSVAGNVADGERVASQNVSDESLAKAVPRELGDYELLSVLGRGGMSVVFSARHKHLGREVAVKLLLPTQQQTVSRERFAREMRAVGALDHPAIVRATDAGESGDTLYLVMDRIDGVDLNRISKLHGPMEIGQACAMIRDVAMGLAYAHERGIIHRDMKPSNIILHRDGNAKILDFGLARVQSSTGDVSLQTTMGQLLGTLDYMAPEQASGNAVDERADVYGLGATLFKLLAGTPPQGRSSDVPIVEFLSRLANDEPARLDAHRNDVPAELVELLAEMLNKDSSKRIAQMDEVVARLEPLADYSELDQLASSSIEALESGDGQDLSTVQESLASHFPTPVEAPAQQQVPQGPVKPLDSGFWGWLPLSLGLASLGGIAALAFAMTIETPEGQIKIESELENIKVEIVDEKDRVKDITVLQGKAMTSVGIGRYRVRLESDLDDIQVSPTSVTVTKDNIFEVTITKNKDSDELLAGSRSEPSGSTPTSKATPADTSEQRDPMVAMQARIDLQQALKALDEAKRKPDKNKQEIHKLESKIVNLRSLSQPIPTEPVYRGRTLSDWSAQMEFETEFDARRAGATAVLRLAETAPIRVRPLLRAGSIYKNGALVSLLGSYYRYSQTPKTTTLIAKMDSGSAGSQLSAALKDKDSEIRDVAFLVCAQLADRIKTELAWRPLLQTLAEQSAGLSTHDTSKQPSLAVRKIVYASCLPDKELATKTIRLIDTADISHPEQLLLLHAAEKLDIGTRTERLTWLGEYLSKLPHSVQSHPFEDDGGLRWDFREQHVQLLSTGPFEGRTWPAQLDEKTQGEVGVVANVLLSELAQSLNTVDASLYQEISELSLISQPTNQVKTLVNIAGTVSLSGEVRDRAIKQLTKRVQQLLQVRNTIDYATAKQLEPLSDVAATLVMLTGELPVSIKADKKTGVLFNGVRELQELGAVNSISLSPELERSAEWYPLEVAETLNEKLVWSSRRRHLIKDLAKVIDPRLAVLVARTADRFHPDMLSQRMLAWFCERHPPFEKLPDHAMDQTKSPDVIAVLFKNWKEQRSDEEIEKKLRHWLRHGNAAHIRAAVDEAKIDVVSSRRGGATTIEHQIRRDFYSEIATAYDRLAILTKLEVADFRNFDLLPKEETPNAGKYAGRFIKRLLNKRQERSFRSSAPRGQALSELYYPIRIFSRSPDSDAVDEILKLVDKNRTRFPSPVDQKELDKLVNDLNKWKQANSNDNR